MGFSELLGLFGWSLAALAALAATAPLVGVFLFARGAAFQGLVLPQLAAFGVALGYAVAPSLGHAHTHAIAAADGVHLAWAAAGVLAGLAALTALARRPGSEPARLAALFVLAQGGTTLAAARSTRPSWAPWRSRPRCSCCGAGVTSAPWRTTVSSPGW